MLIRRIEIENFLSYYGKENTFEFDLGPTIIIGQNNTGKSKLFDAFNWALYDRAFKTEEEKWDCTKDWGEELINNLAKKECSIGKSVDCSVSVLFIDEDDNSYFLTREYRIKKINEKKWDIPKSSELTLTVTEAITSNSKSYYDKEVEEQLYTLFPENLSKYFLFQGENISQILSLNNRSAFNKALRDLSRIEVFERAKGYTDKVLRTIKREFEDKEDSDKALQEKKRRLSEEIQKFSEDLALHNEQFDNACRERDIAKTVYDQKSEELKKYEECAVILKDIDYFETQRQLKNDLRQNLIEAQKKDIFECWMYAGSGSILKNFLQFYNKNKIEKRIPEPIRQEFIKEMLAEKVCKVCGSPALENSKEYNKIKSHLNDKALDKEIELINQLSLVADNMLEKENNIPTEIETFYKKSDEIDKQIKDLQVKIKAKEEELRTISPSDVSEDELKSKNFAQLQRDHDNAKSDWQKYKLKIDQIIGKKEYIQKQLDERQKEYESLIESSSNIIERDRLILAEKINNSVTEFHTVFINRLICDIEKEANTYFQKMTEKNSALSGTLKVDYENREVYTVDENGNRIQNINQANKVSLQISFVAAILSVSNKFWNTFFPFIADAPISALGGNNKLTAVETMIDIFNQSIIILKDDAVTDNPDSMRNELVRNLIKNNNNIKNAYELRMVGETLEEQNTKKIKLK
jgi:DNA sulfur modification protein DndD